MRAARGLARYGDAADRFGLRFPADAAQRDRLEAVALHPLRDHLRRLDAISQSFNTCCVQVLEGAAAAKPSALRPLLRQLLTASALVKGGPSPARLETALAAWEKIPDPHAARAAHRKEVRRLQGIRSALEAEGKPLPAANAHRLEETLFQAEVGALEGELRRFEGEPWKAAGDPVQAAIIRRNAAASLSYAATGLLSRAQERAVERWRGDWPRLPAARVGRTDLVACTPSQAEGAVSALLAGPGPAAAARSKVRASEPTPKRTASCGVRSRSRCPMPSGGRRRSSNRPWSRQGFPGRGILPPGWSDALRSEGRLKRGLFRRGSPTRLRRWTCTATWA